MKEVIFCTNVHGQRDVEHAMKNIEHMNQLYNYPTTFIVSNGIEDMPVLPENVTFKKFPTNTDWRFGPANSTVNCLRLAAESIEDPENYNIVFCHPDLYICNYERANAFLEELDQYDFICRNYIGPDHRGEDMRKLWANHNYYMTEDFYMSGRVLHKFKDVEYDFIKSVEDLLFGVHEISFANLIDNVLKLNVKKIDIEKNTELIENELGFYHAHSHSK